MRPVNMNALTFPAQCTGTTQDPSEVLFELLSMLDGAVEAAGMSPSPDPVTQVAELPVHMHRTCLTCGELSNPLDCMQIFHNVLAADLRDAATTAGVRQTVGSARGGRLHLGRVLRMAAQSFTKPCDAAGEHRLFKM